MNILIIGSYKEDRIASNLIKSINSVNTNTFCLNFNITPNIKCIDPIILDVEEKPIPKQIDVLVQCIPPFMMEYHGKCGLNVGILNLPTYNMPFNWTNKANLLDFHLTTNDVYLNKPYNHLPYGANLNKFKFSTIKELENLKKERFLFYTIVENNRKSGLSDLARLYFSTFKYWENVCLVVKIEGNPVNSNALIDKTLQDLIFIKNDLGLKQSPPIHVMANIENDNLHSSCDCYITANHGIDFDHNAYDALLIGNTPITLSQRFVPYNFISNIDHVYGASADMQTPEVYSHNQKWLNLNCNLSKAILRKAFQHESFKREYQERISSNILSYEEAGNAILKVLENEKQKSKRS